MGKLSAMKTIALAAALFACWMPAAARAASDDDADAMPGMHSWYGTVKDVRGSLLDLQLRTGKIVVVDLHRPLAEHMLVRLTPTRPIIVKGTVDGHVIRAFVIWRSHAMPQYWPADR